MCGFRNALGRVIVRPVTASSSFPPYRASVKDGYAAIASDGTGPRDVVSAMTAGSQVCWHFAQNIKMYRNHSVFEDSQGFIGLVDIIVRWKYKTTFCCWIYYYEFNSILS